MPKIDRLALLCLLVSPPALSSCQQPLAWSAVRPGPTRVQFTNADCNRDGALSPEESKFFTFGRETYMHATIDFKAADTNGNGSLSFEELTAYLSRTQNAWWTNITLDPQQLDCNGDGRYSMAEMSGLLLLEGPAGHEDKRRLTISELQAADTDHDGSFSAGELDALLRGIPCSKRVFLPYCSEREDASTPAPNAAEGAYFVGWGPADLTIDEQGALWVANLDGDELVKVSPAGEVLSTIALKGLQGFVRDREGQLWVVLSGLKTGVAKLSPSGEELDAFKHAQVPSDLTLDRDGRLWVLDATGVTVYNASGRQEMAVKKGGRRITSDPAGGVWITDAYGTQAVRRLSADGGVLVETALPDRQAWDVAVDAGGNAWVYATDKGEGLPDARQAYVIKLSPEGEVLGRVALGRGLGRLAFDPAGRLWVTLRNENRVVRLGTDGAQQATYQTGLGPFGIAFDAAGQAWVTNRVSHLLKKLTP